MVKKNHTKDHPNKSKYSLERNWLNESEMGRAQLLVTEETNEEHCIKKCSQIILLQVEIYPKGLQNGHSKLHHRHSSKNVLQWT